MAGYMYGDTGYYDTPSYAYTPPATGYDPSIANVFKQATGVLQWFNMASSLFNQPISPPTLTPLDTYLNSQITYREAQGERKAQLMRDFAEEWHGLNTRKLEAWYQNQLFELKQKQLAATQALGKAQATVGVSGIGGSPQQSYKWLAKNTQEQLKQAESYIKTQYDLQSGELDIKLEQATAEAQFTEDVAHDQTTTANIGKYEQKIRDYATMQQGDATNRLQLAWKDAPLKRLQAHYDEFMNDLTTDDNLSYYQKLDLAVEYIKQLDKAQNALGGAAGAIAQTVGEAVGLREKHDDTYYYKLARAELKKRGVEEPHVTNQTIVYDESGNAVQIGGQIETRSGTASAKSLHFG